MKKIVLNIGIIGTLLLSPFSYANGPGTTAATFLKIGIGARATAMGGAFTALAGDPTALYWNPAALGHLNRKQISATYNSWFAGVKQGYLALTLPLSRGTMGLGTNYVDVGTIEGRDEYGNPIGHFTASDTHLFVGYGDKFEEISWGITIGTLQDVIRRDPKDAFLATIGLLYPIGDSSLLGFAVQNIGIELAEDPLPLTFRLGTSSQSQTINFALDLVKCLDSNLYYCIGAEWWLVDSLALRFGYRTDQNIGHGLTAGFGLRTTRIALDYAYVPYGDLGNTHRITLGVAF